MIQLNDISITAGNFALSNIHLSVPTAQYGVLMGKTGCGKTTLLEITLGFRRPLAGQVVLGDTDVTDWPPAARGVGYVPQDGALFSTMTVAEQMGLALEIRGLADKKVDARVGELAGMLGIEHLLARYPKGLSGGERQRVALGRALSFRPRVLCLDEPLSALDDETRAQMCELLKQVQRETGVTVLHVTHNLREAEELADCLFRLRDGEMQLRESPSVE